MKKRSEDVKYMVQVNLEYHGKTERYARLIHFPTEPQHNDTVKVRVDGREYSFTVMRRDIGSRQTIWIITKHTHVSKEEHDNFLHDAHWHRGADAKP